MEITEFGMYTVTNVEHDLNEEAPMFVIVFGIVILFNDVQL